VAGSAVEGQRYSGSACACISRRSMEQDAAHSRPWTHPGRDVGHADESAEAFLKRWKEQHTELTAAVDSLRVGCGLCACSAHRAPGSEHKRVTGV